MKKTLFIRAAAIAMLIIFALTAGGCKDMTAKSKYKDLQLESFSITSGGGMSGGRTNLSVRFYKDMDSAIIYNEVSMDWASQPQAECYVVDKAILGDIKQIVLDEKLYKAKDAPVSSMIVYDAPTIYYNINFEGGEYIGYSSSQELPKNTIDAHKKIRAIIDEYCQTGKACPTVYAQRTDGDEYVDLRYEAGVAIRAVNNGAFSIRLDVYNGAGGDGKDIELSGDMVLYKLEGDEVVSQTTIMENCTMTLISGSSDYVCIYLPMKDGIEDGTYKIEYAGYETTFDMKTYKIQR